ncbi:nitric oxide synthase 1-like [Hydra vulgaris]|uniref:Nitric oxide synthase n=1 Tax=Hydra vulgaris TaxID=6087 RepID=A0ABM4BP66_HYDVU
MNKGVVLKNFQDGSVTTDTLHLKAEETLCSEKRCLGSLVMPDTGDHYKVEISKVKEEAIKFLEEYFQSIKCLNMEQHTERVNTVLEEICNTGSYELTKKELIFGAHLAWRNAPRCIGRMHWKKLLVFDCRHVTTTQQVFECCLEHLWHATNKGNIRLGLLLSNFMSISEITIYKNKKVNEDGFRIWNAQLLRYAGYKQGDGTILGDPSSIEMTEIANSLGWVGKRTMFDILPLIIQAGNNEPEWFDIPRKYILEVNIRHPIHQQLDQMGLRWYAVPVVSNMALSCGGLTFTAVPFNGWYMSTEISVRNFGDESRYNLLKPTAELLGYNLSTNVSLWKDRAALELTIAVLHSYQEAGVTIVDHHSSAESFMNHFKQENKLRGGCPSDWVWIVPPLSGSVCPVFHQEMLNYKLKPAFEYQTDPWKKFINVSSPSFSIKKHRFKNVVSCIKLVNSLMCSVVAKRHKVTILYASQSGKAESFAHNLHELFQKSFNSKVICMDQYKLENLKNEKCILVVASTTGNGEAPDNGEIFGRKLYEMVYPSDSFRSTPKQEDQLIDNIQNTFFNESTRVFFSVFGLGSKAYPNFCAFANSINKQLKTLGGEEMYPFVEGDELSGQEDAFKTWSHGCFKAACKQFLVQTDNQTRISQLPSEFYGLIFPEVYIMKSLHEELKTIHQRTIETCKIISVENLQKESDQVTNLVRINKSDSQELSYSPGDHLAIYACNNMVMVDRLISRVSENKLTSSTIVDIELNKDMLCDGISYNQLQKRLPFPNTLGRIFGWYLDITSSPTMKLLWIFASKCKNEREKAMLMKLSSVKSDYEKWKRSSYPTVVDVLEQFLSVKIDFILLAAELEVLKPRYYSISSSENVYPNEIHITVGLVTYSHNNITRSGVCSSWLHSRNPDNEIYCFVMKTPTFRLPSSRSTPIIMVGSGTGIAPFRSFWQQRQYDRLHQNEVEFGEMFLFYGCRNIFENIFSRELEDAKSQDALTEVFVGYSRLPTNSKTYVQNLIKLNSKLVLENFLKKQGHIYVCGNATMALDVQNTIMNIMMESLKCSEHDCKQLIYELKKNGRYHEDVFGVTLNIVHISQLIKSLSGVYYFILDSLDLLCNNIKKKFL